MTEVARAAVAADVATIAELARCARDEAVQYRGGERWLSQEAIGEPLESALTERLEDSAWGMFVGLFADTPVGYSLVHLVGRPGGETWASIEELFVLPEARAVGVGEVLLEATLEWARRQEAASVEALAFPGHRKAKGFFETAGLISHAVVMHKRLDP